MKIKQAAGASEGERMNLPAVFSALIQREAIDSDTIAELETILAKKKAEIGESAANRGDGGT